MIRQTGAVKRVVLVLAIASSALASSSFLSPLSSSAGTPCLSKEDVRTAADAVRTKLANLGISEADVNEAVAWARSCRGSRKTVFLAPEKLSDPYPWSFPWNS